MSTITFTQGQICAIHYWPFPCEPDAIVDPELVLHPWYPVVFPERGGGATVFRSDANLSRSVDERLLWVAGATGATINRAATVQQSADTLEGAGDTILAANRSAIGKFVEGLVASPPICELVPLPPVPVVPPWFVIPTPPPVPPEWKPGEQLSGIDLISVAIRFQAAAGARDAGPLREEFLAAAIRLFEVGAERL
jgi:hypothetical protein